MATNDKPIASPELCEWLAEYAEGQSVVPLPSCERSWSKILNRSNSLAYERALAIEILAACGRAIGNRDDCRAVLIFDNGTIIIRLYIVCAYVSRMIFDGPLLPAAIKAAEAVKGFLEGADA